MMEFELLGTITKSGDYGVNRKTKLNRNKSIASTIRTTVFSEGGELLVMYEKTAIKIMENYYLSDASSSNGSVVAIYDEYNHKILPPTTMTVIQPRHPVPNHGARLLILEGKNEEMKKSKYELSDAMQKYIVSKDDKYIVGKNTLNPTIAKSVTTREGNTRADSSSYLSPDCPNDCEIVAGQEGYPKMADAENAKRLRIRKLTESECYRLMGFEKKDTESCREAGQKASSIYHQAGDSIVTTVLVGIFGELLELDYQKAINQYADKLHNEVK